MQARREHSQHEPADQEIRKLWKSVRSACFDEAVKASAERLRKRLVRRKGRATDVQDLLARCLVSEVCDYYGLFADADGVLREHATGIALKWSNGEVANDPPLVKQQAWVLLIFGECLYRRSEFADAINLLDLCEKVTRQHICEPKPHGLLGRIAFNRGQLAQREGRYEEAERLFEESIEMTLQRLKVKSSKYRRNQQRVNQEHAFASFSVAKTMTVGISWMHFNAGHIRNARPLVISARVFLENTRDQFHTAFAEMILGCIERAEAGRDAVRLDQAIAKLTVAYDTFGGISGWYRALAAYYLALANFYKGEFELAERYAQEVADRRRGDLQWEANSAIILSRICRTQQRSEDAIRWAEEALAKAKRSHHPLTVVEATIALGEATLALGNRLVARKHFDSALEGGRAIAAAKSMGACYLHLARLDIVEHNVRAAQLQLERWNELKPFIENGLLQSWARDIAQELSLTDADFNISRDVKDLNYKRHLEKLQIFLYQQALKLAEGDKQKAASIIGVSRQTIYQWTEPGKYRGTGHVAKMEPDDFESEDGG